MNYKKGNDVKIGMDGFRCIKDNLSSALNEPQNSEFWSAEFTETVPNTIKLVAKKIEYSISRPPSGRGGLQRRIQGIKRFI